MLVICEDCAKKYNIDESRIKSRRARFTCNECGHIIVINKDDIERRLLGGKSAIYSGPSLDLLREMESAPDVPSDAIAGEQGPSAQDAPAVPEEKLVARRNRGVPVFLILIVIMLLFLGCVSFLFGYFFTAHLEGRYLAETFSRQPGLRMEFLLQTSLTFGLAGFCILFMFCILSRTLYQKVKQQIENANRISIGEYDITINTKGPREIRDLAFSLERIRTRLKAASQ